MDVKELLLHRDGAVATLVLNRPHALNALTHNMVTGLASALEAIAGDESVRVLVITGAGRGFCSGMDLKVDAASGGEAVVKADAPMIARLSEGRRGIQRVPLAFQALPQPVIAAVNGPAIGGGMDLASMADIRIAADTARFAMNHVRVARLSLDGGYYYFQRIVGFPKALELVLTSRMFDAQEALALGYVSKVVPPAQLMDAANALAADLAAMPPVAMRLAKQLLLGARESSLEKALEQVEVGLALLSATEDFKEGPRAFAEKRPPRFTGR